MKHDHLTRAVMPPGECHGCDYNRVLSHTKELTAAQAEIARLREVLQKIRDTDWGTDHCDAKNMMADEALNKGEL